MKKRILALLATAIMVVSSTVMTFADTTTGLIGQFNFDHSLKNEVTGATATVTASKVNVELSGSEKEQFSNGVTEGAVLLQGYTSGYGLQLDVAPQTPTFTLSYDIYYINYTQHTATFFLANGWEANAEEWASFGVGWQASLAYAAGVWVHDQVNKTPTEWGDIWTTGGNGDMLLSGDAWAGWKNITYVVTDGVVQVYINGEAVEQGNTQPYIDFLAGNAKLYIGVNAWDTPLDAAVDNVYIYDRALTADDVKELIASRDYDAATKPEFKAPETTSNRPTTAGNDAPWIETFTVAPTTGSSNGGGSGAVIGIAVAVVVVIVVVVVVAVVAGKKKAAADDDDEE